MCLSHTIKYHTCSRNEPKGTSSYVYAWWRRLSFSRSMRKMEHCGATVCTHANKVTLQRGAHLWSTQANCKTKAWQIYEVGERRAMDTTCTQENTSTLQGSSTIYKTGAKTCDTRERRAKEAKISRIICNIQYTETLLPIGDATLRWRTCLILFITWLLSTTFSKCIYILVPHHKATPTTLLTKLQQTIQVLEKTTPSPPLCSHG